MLDRLEGQHAKALFAQPVGDRFAGVGIVVDDHHHGAAALGRAAARFDRAPPRENGCLARPLSGFAETFSHYLIDVAPGGGSESPEPDAGAEGALFVVGGELTLKLAGTEHVLRPGGLLYLVVPASLMSSAKAIPELTQAMITARVRIGKSELVGVPILDLLSITPRK